MRKRTASGKSTSCWRLSFWRFSIGFRIITALFHKRDGDSKESPPLFDRRPAPAPGMGCAGNRNRLRAAQGNALRHAACLFTR